MKQTYFFLSLIKFRYQVQIMQQSDCNYANRSIVTCTKLTTTVIVWQTFSSMSRLVCTDRLPLSAGLGWWSPMCKVLSAAPSNSSVLLQNTGSASYSVQSRYSPSDDLPVQVPAPSLSTKWESQRPLHSADQCSWAHNLVQCNHLVLWIRVHLIHCPVSQSDFTDTYIASLFRTTIHTYETVWYTCCRGIYSTLEQC